MHNLVFTFLAAILSFSFSVHASSSFWDLNDVSYLMPLPKSATQNKLLAPHSPGRGGELLPAKFVTKIPILALHIPHDEQKKLLKVVAVRIDPCFPLPTPQSCQKQIRLVWQPFETGRQQQVQSVDGALHSFYILSDGDFDLLLKDLQQWRKKFAAKTQFVPLQVHPAWAKEGDQSPALQEFQSLVLKYAGAENLSRITAMVLRGAGDMWAFAGFEPRGDDLMQLPVPRLGESRAQSFVNFSVTADYFGGGGLAPKPSGPDSLNNLVFESDLLTSDKDDLVLQESKAVFRIENPHAFNPENMDCVSCHVAQPARHWVLNKRPHLAADQIWSQEIYSNAKYNLENLTPNAWSTLIIRGFGYFGKNIAISQRAINESAEVADAINAYLQSPKR